MQNMRSLILFSVVVAVIVFSCKTEKKQGTDKSYIETIETYRTNRLERLKSPTGWLNLAGLLWLKEGENMLGSDSTNSIVFPEKAKSHLGKIVLDAGEIIYYPKEGIGVTINDEILENKKLKTDADGKPDMIKHGDFGWYVIKRRDKFGIRLRDYNSPLLNKLDSIPAYEIDTDWKIQAKFKKTEEPRKVKVPTVIGVDEEYNVTGLLEFKLNGKIHTLIPFDSKNEFFIIFADETSQSETYPAGRFLYTDSPDDNGNVIIDFNKAYNPPCAFTTYATCPLPPRENILQVAIRAGEKNVHVYEH